MSKRIYKYATGSNPPKGAVYLSTVTQTRILIEAKGDYEDSNWVRCWLVWHYFLVEVKDETKGR